jgi:hypothetical protein
MQLSRESDEMSADALGQGVKTDLGAVHDRMGDSRERSKHPTTNSSGLPLVVTQ